MADQRCIGIVGCGNMGFALARRLTRSGFTVLMGSRDVKIRPHINVEITSIIECIERCSIIFIAIHPEHYTTTLLSPLDQNPTLFDGKILIDVSNHLNNQLQEDELSNAECLQAGIPKAYVVKAFNTISSFVMESTTAGESRCVFVASDHPLAREKVINLAREMNFESFNNGSLRTSRHLETYTRSLFPQWKLPIIIVLCVLFIWSCITVYMRFIKKKTSWNQIFLYVINGVLCSSAITLLALVYMPSNLACIFQLVYGTKDRRFPVWLDRWLLCRKQLGLLTYFIGLCHVLMTLVLISPANYSSWFHPTFVLVSPVRNETKFIVEPGRMTAKGELASLMGILTILSMSLLALASIPAIGNLLNWKEWRFVQSKLGTVTLLLAIGHVFAMAVPRWVTLKSWRIILTIGFICVAFPVLTILLKFILWLPCFARPIRRIRRGEIRKQTV
ncbi:unnamed protein product [Adineta ricciae]|uniref:Pyrroline-5-carboxylate reductase catalytic N-terminal domain-containing protein n=1 Tax=Adineta ricciae TaxID=249248 RepID=A0A815M6D5_ADIRI|nr:unnamed protein product [Adineta ricciae]CAF1417334.1 unnamed protein product [Adineta ricciae]